MDEIDRREIGRIGGQREGRKTPCHLTDNYTKSTVLVEKKGVVRQPGEWRMKDRKRGRPKEIVSRRNLIYKHQKHLLILANSNNGYRSILIIQWRITQKSIFITVYNSVITIQSADCVIWLSLQYLNIYLYEIVKVNKLCQIIFNTNGKYNTIFNVFNNLHTFDMFQ